MRPSRSTAPPVVAAAGPRSEARLRITTYRVVNPIINEAPDIVVAAEAGTAAAAVEAALLARDSGLTR
ncbi:hypothetical protein ACWD4O_37035 [Streptomyces sp. NPDC002623]